MKLKFRIINKSDMYESLCTSLIPKEVSSKPLLISTIECRVLLL